MEQARFSLLEKLIGVLDLLDFFHFWTARFAEG